MHLQSISKHVPYVIREWSLIMGNWGIQNRRGSVKFFRFPPAAGGGGALAPIRGNLLCLHLLPWAPPYCNKLGSQAPRRGMLFWPILQHCSNSIDMLGDCSNS